MTNFTNPHPPAAASSPAPYHRCPLNDNVLFSPWNTRSLMGLNPESSASIFATAAFTCAFFFRIQSSRAAATLLACRPFAAFKNLLQSMALAVCSAATRSDLTACPVLIPWTVAPCPSTMLSTAFALSARICATVGAALRCAAFSAFAFASSAFAFASFASRSFPSSASAAVGVDGGGEGVLSVVCVRW